MEKHNRLTNKQGNNMEIVKTIDKSHLLPTTKDGMFFANKYYISNGKFLLSKDYISTELLTAIEDKDKTDPGKLLILDNIVNNILNDDGYKNATISNLIIINDKNEELRIIYSDSCFLAIDNDYLKMFGLENETIQISDTSAPIRIFKEVKGLLFMAEGLKMNIEQQDRIEKYLSCRGWNYKSLMGNKK